MGLEGGKIAYELLLGRLIEGEVEGVAGAEVFVAELMAEDHRGERLAQCGPGYEETLDLHLLAALGVVGPLLEKLRGVESSVMCPYGKTEDSRGVPGTSPCRRHYGLLAGHGSSGA